LLECLLRSCGSDAHDQLRAMHAEPEVAADHEGQTAEHALLDDVLLAVEKRAHARGQGFVEWHYLPDAARSSAAMSSFFICSIACIARVARARSGSLNSSVMRRGMICHDTPKRSFSQPHCCASGSPPFPSDSQ